MTTARLSFREKIGYGLGDTASNLVFQVMVNYMMIFYTDVFGLPAAAAGTLMLVVRIFDAFTDPVMGGIADRTRTRWGRYRPYLVLTTIPYGVLAVVAFTTPDMADSYKLFYAYITYALLTLAYTAVNIPYSALGGVITADTTERASIQSVRFACAMLGGVIVTAFMMELVDVFGDGNDARGFQLAMAFFAVLAMGCFIVCFLTTKERVTAAKNEARTAVTADLIALFNNDQFAKIAIIAVFLLIVVSMRGAVTPYYVEYFLGRRDLMSVYITTGMLTAFAGAVFTGFACRFIGKLTVFKWAAMGLALSHAALYFIAERQLALSFFCFALANFMQMILVPIMFSMVADCADYGEYKTGKNTMGLAFSTHLLAIKLGFALGAAMVGWILGAVGYIANQVQSSSAIEGIVLTFSLIPAICGLLVFACSFAYRLDNSRLAEIHANLRRTRAQAHAPA